MTDLAERHRFAPPTFADLMAAEHARVQAGADGCGDTCLCHGALTCARLPHPHDPDGDVVPHAGYDPTGQLVQWTCTDPASRALTADDHAKAFAEAKATHRSWLRSILDYDPT